MNTTCPVHGDKYIGRGAAVTDSFQCGECLRLSSTRGRTKKMSLREFQDIFKPNGYVMHGTSLDPESFRNTLHKVSHDEPRAAAIAADARRPRGTDRARFGIAIRAAAREPMLNADRDSIRLGLDYNYSDFRKTSKVAKHKVEAYITVKPTCLEAAKFARNSAFWGERLWRIMSLKFAPGFVAVTDSGHDTSRFNTIGELLAAINKSGWERIR